MDQENLKNKNKLIEGKMGKFSLSIFDFKIVKFFQKIFSKKLLDNISIWVRVLSFFMNFFRKKEEKIGLILIGFRKPDHEGKNDISLAGANCKVESLPELIKILEKNFH